MSSVERRLVTLLAARWIGLPEASAALPSQHSITQHPGF